MPTTTMSGPWVKAWRPPVDGIVEVFHAYFTDHAYPMHTHGSWTLLIVDDGMVRYDLDRHRHGALDGLVTLLPPHVPHNGCSAGPRGFRKRVLYLEPSQLGDELIGRAVDSPSLDDPLLRTRVDQLHGALTWPGNELEAEARLSLIAERLREHLRGRVESKPAARDSEIAEHLRQMLDARYVEGITLQEASRLLHAHPTHLVRVFSREFGIAPHQYLLSRRLDRARGLLLDGMPPRLVAAVTGFYDQPHLTRHFKRFLGISPGRYARSSSPAPAPVG
jgi:AraC-like DNA-binding protein